jgi:phosphotransferase system HPr (HPr) family protein
VPYYIIGKSAEEYKIILSLYKCGIMIEKKLIMQIGLGQHARPSRFLNIAIKAFDLDRAVMYYGDKKADMTLIIELLQLGVAYGEEAKVIISGKQEKEAILFVEKFFNNLYETEIYDECPD